MEIQSTRFGCIEFAEEDVIRFPEGLPGLTECRDWVMLAEADRDAVAWIQSLQRPEVALAVVSPRRFVPGYQLRVARRELEPLGLDAVQAARVLAIVSPSGDSLTLNLKAPLVVNLDRRVGRQVVANGELPVQHEVGGTRAAWKKTA